MSDVLNRDLFDGIYFDFTFLHPVRRPTVTFGRVQMRTPQVIAPLRTPSRRRLVKTTGRWLLRRNYRAGKVRVNELPAVPGLLKDVRPCFVSRRSANRTRPTRLRRLHVWTHRVRLASVQKRTNQRTCKILSRPPSRVRDPRGESRIPPPKFARPARRDRRRRRPELPCTLRFVTDGILRGFGVICLVTGRPTR
jgi:hypothetical protein